MRKHSVVRVCTAALALLLVGATLEAQAPAATSPGGPGIKVHGRWTIDVLNPDGSLASHHEFDNALTGGGRRVLALLLGRFYNDIDAWEVSLSGTHGLCVFSDGQPRSQCQLREYRGTGATPMGMLTLNLPRGTDGGLVGTMELIGVLQVAGSGTIEWVATHLDFCLVRSGSSCSSSSGFGFTSHQLSAPINVAANQVVQVKVVISFS